MTDTLDPRFVEMAKELIGAVWSRFPNCVDELAHALQREWLAGRAAEQGRTTDFLRKLAWTEEDIENWRKWKGAPA